MLREFIGHLLDALQILQIAPSGVGATAGAIRGTDRNQIGFGGWTREAPSGRTLAIDAARAGLGGLRFVWLLCPRWIFKSVATAKAMCARRDSGYPRRKCNRVVFGIVTNLLFISRTKQQLPISNPVRDFELEQPDPKP